MVFRTKIQDLIKKGYAFPAIILALTLLAYGLLAFWHGFYWDDWPFAWIHRFFGPLEFIEAFRPFRPFLGYIFAVTTFIAGNNPLAWQIAGLAARFLLSCGLWTVLKQVWPSNIRNSFWVVLFFTVFPGYQQQWVSLTHVNQEIIPFIWLMFSFAATAYALRKPEKKIFLSVIAVVLQALGLFSTEYFFGIEIFRLLFIIVICMEAAPTLRAVIRKVFLNAWFYLLVWAGNAVWVYSYHHSSAYKSYGIQILSKFSFSPISILNEIISTFTTSGFVAWLNTFQIASRLDGSLTQLFSLLLMAVTAVMIYFFMHSLDAYNPVQPGPDQDRWGIQAVILGIIVIFAGRLPSWAAGLPLRIEFDYDRLMLPIMLGASLFVVGVFTLLIKDGKRKILVFSLLIAFSTALQFNLSNSFRRDWNNQKTFLWQLTWRVPALEKGTTLLTYELPIQYASDFQITAPINWIYSPDLAARELPYLLIYIKSRINSPALPSLTANLPIEMQYRTTLFSGNTSNSIVIYKETDGCLRVLDPEYGNAETVPGANYYLTDAIPLSNPRLILADAPQAVPDENMFGKEPAHDWCFYYEKAELARQKLDWHTVRRLYGQAREAGLSAFTPAENLPFIEALALEGETKTALELSQQTLKQQKDLCPALHTLWQRVVQTSDAQNISGDVSHHLSALDACKP